MKTGTVVEGFDVVEDRQEGLIFSFWDGGAEAFGFESGPKRLHGRVVVTVAAAVAP